MNAEQAKMMEQILHDTEMYHKGFDAAIAMIKRDIEEAKASRPEPVVMAEDDLSPRIPIDTIQGV